MTNTKTKEIVRSIILNDEENSKTISKCVSVFAHRPFNMKGQELEEIIGYVHRDGLKNIYGISQPYVNVPQNKKTADIKFEFTDTTGDKRNFDIKSYGAAKRFQISTCKSILDDLRDKFAKYDSQTLNESDKNWVINKVKTVELDYNLSFLTFIQKNGDIDIHCFDFDKIDIDVFKNLPFQLIKKTKEKRIEIHIQITKNSYLEISAGRNPLNRGIWLNKVKDTNDINSIYQTKFVNKLYHSKMKLKNFDKDEYIFEKARQTIQIVNKYFES